MHYTLIIVFMKHQHNIRPQQDLIISTDWQALPFPALTPHTSWKSSTSQCHGLAARPSSEIFSFLFSPTEFHCQERKKNAQRQAAWEEDKCCSVKRAFG